MARRKATPVSDEIALDEELGSSAVSFLEDTDESDDFQAIEADEDKTPDSPQKKRGKPKEAIKAEDSLYAYLVGVGLERKLIDIAIAQGQTPNNLRKECEQEIRFMWSTCKPDLSYKPGQIAAYAHRMAGHAILRVRRDLGSACRLPASAFRKRKDGSTYVTPGLLAKTLDWSAMEDWLPAGEEDISDLTPSMSFIDEDGNTVTQDEPSYENTSESATHELLNLLSNLPVTPKQKQIALMLAEGYTFAEIQTRLNIKRNKISAEMDVVKRAISALR